LQENIRKVFTPRPNCLFVRADYSQLEVRLLAHCADEQFLINAFATGFDLHSVVAKEIFNLDCDVKDVAKLHKPKRSAAKAIVFGLSYGMTAIGLAKKLKISQMEAQSYIDAFYAKYARLQWFRQYCDWTIGHNKFISTIMGRKRRFKWVNSRSLRQGVNFPIQGTAGEVMKHAMVRIYSKIAHRHDEIRMLMQIHDEALLESVLQSVPETVSMVKSTMEEGLESFGVKFKVPMIVDPSVDYAWGFSMKEAKIEEGVFLTELREAFDSNNVVEADKKIKQYYNVYFRELRQNYPKELKTLPDNKIIVVSNNILPAQHPRDFEYEVKLDGKKETKSQAQTFEFREGELKYMLHKYSQDQNYNNYRSKFGIPA